MKKQIVFIVVGMIMTLGAWAQTNGDFPVPLSDPNKRGKLNAHINSGSITVKGTARKDVLIKYSAGDKDEHDGPGKDGLKRISSGTMDLEVSENSNNVKVGSDSWNNKLNLEIEVPAGFDIKVSTYNDGDLIINGIQGEVELTNYNGEITAENISGSVVASTYNGEIKATFDKVTEGAPMSFTTWNGDVDLTFPANLKATLKMKTERGEILTGFDVNLVKSGPVKKSDSKSGTYKVTIDEWVKGDVNGGGPEFSVKNYNGDIMIRKK
jgi:Putative adhesin